MVVVGLVQNFLIFMCFQTEKNSEKARKKDRINRPDVVDESDFNSSSEQVELELEQFSCLQQARK